MNITDKKLRETIVSIPDGDRNRIFIIIGSAGMGKSFLLNYGEDDTKILKKLWRDTVKDVVAQNLADLRAKSPDFVVKDIKWPSLRAALIQCIKDVQASAVVATDEANMIDRRPMDDVSSLNAKMDILFEEWRSRPWELSSSDEYWFSCTQTGICLKKIVSEIKELNANISVKFNSTDIFTETLVPKSKKSNHDSFD